LNGNEKIPAALSAGIFSDFLNCQGVLVADGDGAMVFVGASVAVGVTDAVGVSSTGVAVISKISKIQPSIPLSRS
jgi:hypothetical protein